MSTNATRPTLYWLWMWVILLIALPASATTSQPDKAQLESLTHIGFHFKKAIPILTSLEDQNGDLMLPMFQAMLNGKLYYNKADRALLIATKKEGKQVYLNPFNQQQVGDSNSIQAHKIGINNALRAHLGNAIARLELDSKDPKQRSAAAQELFGDTSALTIKRIEQVLPNISKGDTRHKLSLTLHMAQLKNAKDSDAKIKALKAIGTPLEPQVRNLLRQSVEQSQDAKVKAMAQKALDKIASQTSFYHWLDKVFFGLSLGSVLLLAAIGLAITFGVMGVINMAHGEMMMLGAYTTYVIQQVWPNEINQSLWLALPCAFIVSGGVGILIERFVIRYLRGRPLETLLATFGISLLLQQLVRTVFSPLNREVASPDWMSGSLAINPVFSLTYNRLYILIFALIVFAALMLLLKKTSLGLHVRAVSQNRQMARALGIRSDRVDALTFGLGSGIAGIAGVALSQLTNVGPNLGQSYIIDSFMVVVFGGVGNLFGTVVAAFILGLVNKFLEPVAGAVLAKIVILVFIILFIQKRPKGLFPQKGRAAD
ncbi:urea ABC transporter permease subunit UrtB [Celerinatantimonas sp. MCCC 1A17872]|uniref:urea ABC transporter permease subunit UrtB n=1 Tax=Celerinatantimonas sp. MCCC 1A17872 TaxID=3177514 RepID=UPI0038C0E366